MKHNKKITIAYSNIIGDLFHFGHLQLLKKAKARSDIHICGVITDNAACNWESPLVCNYTERSKVIESIKFVDKIMKQDSIDPSRNLEKIKLSYPNATIIFFPIHKNWNLLPGSKIIKATAGKIVRSQYYKKLSRENIRNAFLNERPLSYDNKNQHLPNLNISKADTLKNLSKHLKDSFIEKLIVFTISEWKKNRQSIINDSINIFKKSIVIVRSSSLSEDTENASNAGLFHSELNVRNNNIELEKAITKVIKSYKKGNLSKNDQVIIQKQSNNIALSGVCFTRNVRNNAPYYIINYDDKSFKTDTVTGGLVSDKVEIIRSMSLSRINLKWRGLIKAIREIEALFPNIALDIEFGINKFNKIIIFQVRPLATDSIYPKYNDDKIFNIHQNILKNYANNNEKGACLSDMGFWNPAELLGDRPSPLATSLFDEIITKDIWNSSLITLGYTKIPGSLVVEIGGKPYINLEKTFKTLTPANIDEKLSSKLVKYYTKKLRNNPSLHDKLEFDIVFSSYNFSSKNNLAKLQNHNFSIREINMLSKSLLNNTNKIFQNYKNINQNDDDAIKKLNKANINIKYKNLNDKIKALKMIINKIREYGTPQFCRAARLSFLTKDILNSFINENKEYKNEIDLYMTNIKTISSDIQNDMYKSKINNSEIKFMNKYGHLRPDTYNICSKRYLDIKNLVMKSSKPLNHANKVIKLSNKFKENFTISLKDNKLSFTTEKFFKILNETIKKRESYKFHYTKLLSNSLELIGDIGQYFNINKKDISCLDYKTLINICSAEIKEENMKEIIMSIIKERKKIISNRNQISLPSLLFNRKDLELISYHNMSPNYVTNDIIESEIIVLDNNKSESISNKIVLVKNADPGYDWIFSQNIKGLVTQYGGVASHMAIRCSEFNLPAAIGCGNLIYDKLLNAKIVLLDCKNKKLEKII